MVVALVGGQSSGIGILDEAVLYEMLHQVLKVDILKPWPRQKWCIPPQHSGAFVCHMEDSWEPIAVRQIPSVAGVSE